MNKKKRRNNTSTILVIIGILLVVAIVVVLVINATRKNETVTRSDQTDLIQTTAGDDKTPYGDAESDDYDFSGDYFDLSSQKGTMTISRDGADYAVSLTYAESDDSLSMWSMTATYNKSRRALNFRDCERVDYIFDDSDSSDAEKKVVYSDGSGWIYLSDGNVYWVDDKENMGTGLIFKKVDEITPTDLGAEESDAAEATDETGEEAADESAGEATDAAGETTDTTDTTGESTGTTDATGATDTTGITDATGTTGTTDATGTTDTTGTSGTSGDAAGTTDTTGVGE